MKQENIQFVGIIVEDKSNSIFEVELIEVAGRELEATMTATCTISGKIRINGIRLNVGDKVQGELSLYDMSKGRILYRYNVHSDNPGGRNPNSRDKNNRKKKK